MHLESDLDRVSDQADIPHSGHKQPYSAFTTTNTNEHSNEHNKHTGKPTQMHTIFRDPYYTTPFTKDTLDHSTIQLFDHSNIRLFDYPTKTVLHLLTNF